MRAREALSASVAERLVHAAAAALRLLLAEEHDDERRYDPDERDAERHDDRHDPAPAEDRAHRAGEGEERHHAQQGDRELRVHQDLERLRKLDLHDSGGSGTRSAAARRSHQKMPKTPAVPSTTAISAGHIRPRRSGASLIAVS